MEIIMKKTIKLVAALSILLTMCSCSALYSGGSRGAQRTAGSGTDGVFYGRETGTDKTYTGLEPLEKRVHDFSGMRTDRDKSTIEHSFGAAKNGAPHQISVGAQSRFDELGLDAVVYDNRTDEKKLYLTFDCGYENGQTKKILDVLRDKNVEAAFFCTLPDVKSSPELIARMINEGHIVGNHSVTHPDFSSISHEEMAAEVGGFDDYLREHFGYSSLYFRFPQGKYSDDAVEALNAMGYKCVFWSIAYYDWNLNEQPGVHKAVDTVIERLHPGAVLLLHSVSPDNAAALPEIIEKARALGYTFGSLTELE